MVTGRSGANGLIQMGAVSPKNRFINLLRALPLSKSITPFLASEGLVRVFYWSSDGSNKKFASGKIHFQFYSCDKKFIEVNVKPTFYCSLL